MTRTTEATVRCRRNATVAEYLDIDDEKTLVDVSRETMPASWPGDETTEIVSRASTSEAIVGLARERSDLRTSDSERRAIAAAVRGDRRAALAALADEDLDSARLRARAKQAAYYVARLLAGGV